LPFFYQIKILVCRIFDNLANLKLSLTFKNFTTFTRHRVDVLKFQTENLPISSALVARDKLNLMANYPRVENCFVTLSNPHDEMKYVTVVVIMMAFLQCPPHSHPMTMDSIVPK